jgi:G3E family GTPase
MKTCVLSCSWQTTFLNYVLTARHGKKIAVIQNEFGIGTGTLRSCQS